jgi:hypothetical protein
METQEDELEEIIEHKIMKVNGEIGYKKYQRGKLLGKGTCTDTQVGSPNAIRDSTSRPKRPTRSRSLTRSPSKKTEPNKKYASLYAASL